MAVLVRQLASLVLMKERVCVRVGHQFIRGCACQNRRNLVEIPKVLKFSCFAALTPLLDLFYCACIVARLTSLLNNCLLDASVARGD